MSEATNVRLVRCPKCENLLPEITSYSVYQCGGCGTVLEAKNKGVDLDTFSEKSNEERREGPRDSKLSDRYEKVGKKSDKRMELSDSSGSDSAVSSSSRAERRRMVLHNRGESRRSRTIVPRKDEKNFDLLEAELIQDEKRSHDLQQAKAEQDFEDLLIYRQENMQGVLHGRNGDKHEIEGNWSSSEIEDEMRQYGKEGPPNPQPASAYNYDRAELLKQVDELKDRLTRSGNMVDKNIEKIPLDRKTAFQDPYGMQNSYHGQKSYSGPLYPNQYGGLPRLMQRQESGGRGFYLPQFKSGPHQAPTPYHVQQPPHAFKSRPYMDDGMMYMDAMEPPSSYHHNFSCHHPSCSCHQCRAPFKPPSYGDQYSIFSNGSGRSEDYGNRIFTDLPLLSDVNSTRVDGFVCRRPARAPLAAGRRICRPIGSGAPFFTCKNCFELLLLPKVSPDGNNGRRKKMRCGSCSTIIIFTVNDNKLGVSSDVEPDEDYKGNCVKVKKSTKNGISNKLHRGSHSREAGNKSGLPEKEKVILNQNDNTNERISGKESLSTEIELSSNEYLNTGTTFDSDKASREGDCLKGRNAAKSLIGGIGFSDSSRPNEDFEQEKARVTVNGHLIPARLIKKAEKLAGPIQPGNYWYDSRAGFWGYYGRPLSWHNSSIY